MNKRVAIIIVDKEELMYASYHMLIVDTSFHNNNDTHMSPEYRKYGVVMLCLGVLGDQNKEILVVGTQHYCRQFKVIK